MTVLKPSTTSVSKKHAVLINLTRHYPIVICTKDEPVYSITEFSVMKHAGQLVRVPQR